MLEQRGQRHVLGAKGEAVYRTGAQQARFTLFPPPLPRYGRADELG